MLNNEFADGFRIASIIDYDIDMISNNSGLTYLPETIDCYLQKNSTNLRVAKSAIQSCVILKLR